MVGTEADWTFCQGAVLAEKWAEDRAWAIRRAAALDRAAQIMDRMGDHGHAEAARQALETCRQEAKRAADELKAAKKGLGGYAGAALWEHCANGLPWPQASEAAGVPRPANVWYCECAFEELAAYLVRKGHLDPAAAL